MSIKCVQYLGLVCCLLAATYNVHAQQKQAYLSVKKIMATVPGYTVSVKKSDSLVMVYREDIEQKNQSIDKKLSLLLASYKTEKTVDIQQLKTSMTTEDKAKLALLEEESKLLKSSMEVYNEKLSLLRQKEQHPLEQKVQAIVDIHVKNNGIDVVHDLDRIAGTLVFLEPELNITDTIIAAIKSSETFLIKQQSSGNGR